MATQPATAPASASGRPNVNRLLIGGLVIVALGCVATLLGWDVSGWVKHILDTLKTLPLGYLLAGIALLTLQTGTTAYAWYSILRWAYPDGQVLWIRVFACYAAAVALNYVLPANLGTLAMLLMFTATIVGCTFTGAIAGYVVQKIFYSVVGTAGYVYLFLSVRGSFSLQLGFAGEHPWATVILAASVVALLILVARVLRPKLRRWWADAKEGGEILAHRGPYLRRVVFPEAISWLAMLGVMSVFLAAYNIPVSFHTLMRIVAGNSVANMTSVTPGGAGVVQGFNVLSLKGITSSANATAYSVAQQLVSTVWSILLALVLLIRAFGWSDGKTLVEESYRGARQKASERSAERHAKRSARRSGSAGGEEAAGEPEGAAPI
jgi:uncharacterized membrane protein YbhN (UPF0104 family)